MWRTTTTAPSARSHNAGAVTTLAGSPGQPAAAPMARAAPRGSTIPTGVAVDGSGNVYVADHVNYTIRKITAGGVVTTLAGSARNLGQRRWHWAAPRGFTTLTGWRWTADGNVYVADTRTTDTIRKITTAGVVTTLAGTAGSKRQRGWDRQRRAV